MTDFDLILETCLDELAGGASTLDECLVRHPEHAAQLEPLLLTALQLQGGRAVRPSAAFKARTRAQLTSHMQAHPRAKARPRFTFWQLGLSLAVLTLTLLVTGTAYAQGALPGDAFYPWKLTSERAWRAVSPDPVNLDLVLANRRIREMNAVADDPVRQAQALEGYQKVVTRLKSEVDPATLERILPKIEVEQKPTPKPAPEIPTPAANVTVPPHSDSTPGPGPDLPPGNPPVPNNPNPKPKVIPTIEIPPPMR